MKDLSFEIIYEQMQKDGFADWLKKNIKPSKYINIRDKYDIIKVFTINFAVEYLNDMFSEDEGINTTDIYKFYTIEKEIELIFKYINRGIYVPSEYKDEDLYDLIHTSGLYSYVLKHCGEDFERLSKECDRVSGIDSMSIVYQISEIFTKLPSVLEFDQSMNALKEVMTDKDVKDTLDALNKFEEFNDPTMKEFVDNLKRESIRG